MSEQTGRVRRGTLRRRLDPTTMLAVVLPVVTAVALLLTHPDPWSQPTQRPASAPMTTATVACPSAMRGQDSLGVTSVTKGRSGPVALSGAGAKSHHRVDAAAGQVTRVPAGSGEVVLTASGTAASGLLAGRASLNPLAATDCPPTVADQWFTGLGSGPVHDSTVELVNPNDGDAVVDVTALGGKGPLTIPQLRGIAVRGHSARSFDLGRLVPQLGSLALHVTVSRGQVVAAVRDRAGQLAGGFDSEEWLAGQPTPSRSNLLLGFPHGGTSHGVTVANGGDSQVTVTLRIVTPDAVLTPAGAPTLDVPPDSVASVSLQKVLGQPVAKDAYGVEVDASGPVTASLRSVAAGDLTVTTPARPISRTTALVLPTGAGVTGKRIALAGATGVGAVTVVSSAADGRQLKSQRVALQPQQGGVVDVPADAALVQLIPEHVGVAAAAYLSGKGAASVPFRQLVTSASVPAVRVGLR